MSGETVLIVEDNEVLLDGLKVLLEQEKYNVMTAVHGLDGLEKMRSYTPDLILCDIVMPEMDGYIFFEEVRSRPEWVSVPVVFLTARREREHVLEAKKLGAEDFLMKPIASDELLTVIRSRLVRSHQLLFAQLHNAYEASLIVLANAIEVRDPYTRGHVERVMNYAQTIAKQMGWQAAELSNLRFGTILHDIGKIHISESILHKEGPLDDEEWNEMKRHPQLGVDLIKDVNYLARAIPIILRHHERWDGRGYPGGLVGEAIPLPARIASVADSFDAMTTFRSYRDAMTAEQAYEEILRGSGTQYDPDIVAAFTKVWQTGKIHSVIAAFP
jgi:putative two-component system response regulator